MELFKKCGRCKSKKELNDYKKENTNKLYKTCIKCRNYQKERRNKKKLNKKVEYKKETYELKYIIKKQIYLKELLEKKGSVIYIEEEMPRTKKINKFVNKYNTENGLREAKEKYKFEMNNEVYENKMHADIKKQFNFRRRTALSSFVSILLTEINDRKYKINDLKKLMKNNKVQNILYAISDNKKTIRKNCTFINNYIKNKFGNDIDKNLLVFLKLEDAIELNKTQEQKAIQNNENSTILKYDNILKVVNKIKNSSGNSDKIIFAGLCLGSRLIEILRLGKFTEETKDTIKQEGIAKNQDVKEVIKPVLFTTSQNIIKIVEEIRENIGDVKDLTNQQLTDKYGLKIRNRLKRISKNILNFENIKFHDLRRIYGNLAYETKGKETKQSYISYVKNILGHKGITSVKNYSNLKITFNASDKKEEKKEEKKKENKTGYDDLKTFEYMNTKERGRNALNKRISKIEKLVKVLESRNIKVTNKLLKQFSYGVPTIRAYKSFLRSKEEK